MALEVVFGAEAGRQSSHVRGAKRLDHVHEVRAARRSTLAAAGIVPTESIPSPSHQDLHLNCSAQAAVASLHEDSHVRPDFVFVFVMCFVCALLFVFCVFVFGTQR